MACKPTSTSFCYKYFPFCLRQRILCEASFASFPVSFLVTCFAVPRQSLNRQRQQQRNTSLPHYQSDTRAAWLCNCSKASRPIHCKSRQSALQRQLAPGMPPTPEPAAVHAYMRARQTARGDISNESIYLQDVQKYARIPVGHHWLFGQVEETPNHIS